MTLGTSVCTVALQLKHETQYCRILGLTAKPCGWNVLVYLLVLVDVF